MSDPKYKNMNVEEMRKEIDRRYKENPEAVNKVLEEFFKSCHAADALSQKTDTEIAVLMETHLWGVRGILEVECSLIEEAIVRLQRSGGGPMIIPEENCEPAEPDMG